MYFKVHPRGKMHPELDLYTFVVDNTTSPTLASRFPGGGVWMFKHQIRNGHNPNGRVPFFDAPTAAIFPMRTVTYMGREVKVPNDVDVVLSTLHGDQWPVDCRPSWSHAHKTSFGTHRHGRPGKDYALSFPCRLMPKAYHGDFMDGRGLERFGYPRSSLLPPVTKAPAGFD